MPKKFRNSYIVEFGHHDYKVGKGEKAEICTLEELFASVPKT